MKVLVTGASGFIGGYLVRALVDHGHDVTVLIRDKNKFENSALPNLTWVEGDILDKESLHLALKGQHQVYHLAGLIAYSKCDRESMFKVNVEGTNQLLQAAYKNEVQRVLLVSSVVAVGASFQKQVLNEDSPYKLGPYHLGYHESKREAERLLKKSVDEKKVDGVIVNPSTVYGAGDARKGSRGTQLKVASGRGLFIPPGGVSVTGVEDVVHGMLMAMTKGRSGERYILAGDNLSLKEVFQMISAVAGVVQPSIPIPAYAMRGLALLDEGLNRIGLRGPLPSERALVASMYHWYDSTKAINELGYRPTGAMKAIENSVRWMKDNGLLEH